MIDEIYKLPESGTWTAETARNISKILSYLHQRAIGIEYTDSAPTKMGYGKFIVMDDGTTQRLYFKSASNTAGTINYGDSSVVGGTAGAVQYDTGSAIAGTNAGTAGQFFTSQAGTAAPTWTAPSESVEWVSTTTPGAATSTGAIAITQGNDYLVLITFRSAENADATLTLRYNTDVGASYANSGEARGSSNEINLGAIDTTAGAFCSGYIYLTSIGTQLDQVATGNLTQVGAGNTLDNFPVTGYWSGDTATSFKIEASTTINMDSVVLYKMNIS